MKNLFVVLLCLLFVLACSFQKTYTVKYKTPGLSSVQYSSGGYVRPDYVFFYFRIDF